MMSAVTSLVMYPDSSPPEPGNVYVGQISSHVHITSCEVVHVYWNGFVDPESVRIDYQVAVGSSKYSDDILNFMPVNSNFAVLEGLALHEGHKYYIIVKVRFCILI